MSPEPALAATGWPMAAGRKPPAVQPSSGIFLTKVLVESWKHHKKLLFPVRLGD